MCDFPLTCHAARKGGGVFLLGEVGDWVSSGAGNPQCQHGSDGSGLGAAPPPVLTLGAVTSAPVYPPEELLQGRRRRILGKHRRRMREKEAAVGGKIKRRRSRWALRCCSEMDGGNFIRRPYQTVYFKELLSDGVADKYFLLGSDKEFFLEQQESEVVEEAKGGMATGSDGPHECREPEMKADVTEFHISTDHLLPERCRKDKKTKNNKNPTNLNLPNNTDMFFFPA